MSNENPRETFDKNEAGIVQTKQAIAEAAAAGDYDKVATLAQEAKGMEAAKGEMVGEAQGEALDDNKTFDEAKAAEEKAKRDAELAEQAKLQAEKDSQEAAALLAKLQGGTVESTPVEQVAGAVIEGTEPVAAENTVDGRPIEEQIGAPKTAMFEKYGQVMRKSALELVSVVKAMDAKKEELKTVEFKSPQWQKLWNESEALNNQRNKLRNEAMWSGVSQRGEEIDPDKYKKTAMSDPQTVLSLAESGSLGNGYSQGEGIGQVSGELRGNAEYMAKLLDLLPANAAENFWAQTQGEARQNKDLYLAAVAKNHLNYQFGNNEWKKDPEVQKAALASGLSPEYLQK